MSAHDILFYIFLIFMAVVFTIFNKELHKHITGKYKQTKETNNE